MVNSCLPIIIKTITKARSRIHLIYDSWISSNYITIFGVIAWFLNKNLQLQSILLSLPKLINEHINIHLTEAAFTIIKKYDFTERLGFIIADNADNNQTIIEEIKR